LKNSLVVAFLANPVYKVFTIVQTSELACFVLKEAKQNYE